MTTTTCNPAPATEFSEPVGALNGADVDTPDPVTVPHPSTTIADALPRSPVVLRGMVRSINVVELINGPILKVQVSDGTGTFTIAFLGRRSVGGLTEGRQITAAGKLGTRGSRSVLLNPYYWLGITTGDGNHA